MQFEAHAAARQGTCYS